MQETLTHKASNPKLLNHGSYNSRTRTFENRMIYVINTTRCRFAARLDYRRGARGDACLGADCIILQHGTQAAKLLNPKCFFPLHFSTPRSCGRGPLAIQDIIAPIFIKHTQHPASPWTVGGVTELCGSIPPTYYINTSHFIDS